MKSERSHYRDVCQKSAETVERLFETEIPQPGANISPKTNKGCIHYSFDMAQQVFTTISNSTILLLHRFTILMTLCSLDPSISWHQGNVLYLGFAVRLYCVKWGTCHKSHVFCVGIMKLKSGCPPFFHWVTWTKCCPTHLTKIHCLIHVAQTAKLFEN